MSRIRKGDTVTVLRGRDKGKRGKILRVFGSADEALVERINLMKHFEQKSQQNPAGGIIEREAPLPLSALAIVCQRCNKPSRIGVRVGADGMKQRVCHRCKEVIQ
ncbi:MAG: 50S ribosomal protein L24 [Candidatus Omnitrophica bacterium]|nr:50S ribosomal protein L24 [Candidatus Omnitrophota bacterium]